MAIAVTTAMPTRLLSVCLLVLWIGCGKQSDLPTPSAPTADKTEVAPETGTEGSVATSTPVTDEAQIATLLSELTQAVRKYGVEQQRAPKMLEELVGKGYLSAIPQAPAGKKFAINKNLQVYLADQ